jgi:hypothetical protein
MNKTHRLRLPTIVVSAFFAAVLGGCGAIGQSPAPVASASGQKPIPRVQDCAVLNTGTPSRFACNGKTYTSYQLAKLREDEAKKYASGK